MWDYLVLAAYLFGTGLNVYLMYYIWRTQGACWRIGLGLALAIIFAGLFTDKLKEVQRPAASETQVAQAL